MSTGLCGILIGEVMVVLVWIGDGFVGKCEVVEIGAFLRPVRELNSSL